MEDFLEQITGSLWIFLGFGLVLIVGVWLILKFRSRFEDGAGSASTENLMLSQIGDLKRQGDLTDEEYRSIKGRLVEKLDGPRTRGDSEESETGAAPASPEDSPEQTRQPNESAE